MPNSIVGDNFSVDTYSGANVSDLARHGGARATRRIRFGSSIFCIPLDRSQGRRQEGVEPRPYDGVALTRCLFEAAAIENLNFSPTIVDKAGLLHRLRCKRHRFAIGTQHVRQELVRVWQVCAIGPIMHHKEPSAYSLFRCMQGIARDSLLNLRQQRLRIADEEIAHVFTALEFRLQQFDRAAKP